MSTINGIEITKPTNCRYYGDPQIRLDNEFQRADSNTTFTGDKASVLRRLNGGRIYCTSFQSHADYPDNLNVTITAATIDTREQAGCICLRSVTTDTCRAWGCTWNTGDPNMR